MNPKRFAIAILDGKFHGLQRRLLSDFGAYGYYWSAYDPAFEGTMYDNPLNKIGPGFRSVEDAVEYAESVGAETGAAAAKQYRLRYDV